MHRAEVQQAKKRDDTLDESAIAVLEDQVRETYYRHDRELSNPASKQLFEDNRPALDSAQVEVLDSLVRDGLCVIRFSDLFDDGLWRDLAADSQAFQSTVEADLEAPKGKEKDAAKAAAKAAKREKAGKPPKKKKFILHRQLASGASLTLDNPWLRLAASTRVLDIVNTYLSMYSKLSYVDEWYTVPGGSEAERLGSQRWHRDYNDQHLVKVFLYMSDVDAGSGPFEYVPGSARGGPYENDWPWQPLGDTYPAAAEFEQRIPGSAVRTLTAPAGTMIFCNTAGFHRGGFATERRRVLGVLNYVSPAALESLVVRNFTIDPDGLPADLPPQVRFALN